MKTLVACILNQMLKKQNRSLAVMELVSYHVKEALQKIGICPFDFIFFKLALMWRFGARDVLTLKKWICLIVMWLCS